MRGGGICPKCKTGNMYQPTFGSCNWYCDLCGYKEWRAPPPSEYQRYQQNLKEREEAKRKRRQARRAAKAARRGGRAEKKFGQGTIAAILLLLWLLSKLL